MKYIMKPPDIVYIYDEVEISEIKEFKIIA